MSYTHEFFPIQSNKVLAEVADERERQDIAWGEQNHPNHVPGQGPLGVEKLEREATHWKNRNRHRVNRDELAWDGILLEEAFEAVAETDPAKLRAELIQVAAVAVCWVEAIDRRTASATPAAALEAS